MKHLVGVILVMMMLLAGCSRSVDSRLSLADSLIDEQADSAYMMLKGVNADELTTTSDRAYYALLYTQALYKNMDSIASDSLINIAVDYYADNHNRELNTRTLIYKGAVMQELGKEQEAMEWYKRAEDNASEDDYMNLGQANLRMAVLYSLNYTDNRVIIEKYKQALYNFQKAGSKQYQVMCLSSIGGELRNINIDSAIIYLEKSIQLSKELDNSFLLYRSLAMLTRAYFSKNDFKRSKDLALAFINTENSYVGDDIYYDIVMSYAHLGMPDSAEYYLSKTNEVKDDNRLKLVRTMAISAIYESRGDYQQSLSATKKADSISYSIESGSLIKDIVKIETLYSKAKLDNLHLQLKNVQLKSCLYISICAIVILIITFITFVYIRKRKRKLDDAYQLIDALNKEKNDIYIRDNIRSESIRKLTENHKRLMNRLIECSYKYKNHPELFIKIFSEIIESVKATQDFWETLIIYINDQYDNFIDELKNTYPNLNNDDIKIITLICCGYSPLDISIYMGYANNTYIYRKKKNIASKMDLSISLDDFIAEKLT